MKKARFQDLLKLAEILRSEKGCPWDREQSIASMLEFIESEVHEVRVAIENGDHKNLREELGDVMFQLIMLAQIAKENGYFDMDNVINDINKKVIDRHTWVFGDDKVETAQEAIALWRKNKAKEKQK